MVANNIVCIACSIFKKELAELQRKGLINIPIKFLDSVLHIYPEKLRCQLTDAMEEETKNGDRIVLIYGDCHCKMIDSELKPNVVRTRGVNCCEILLGSDEYTKMRKEKVFFLMPEWAVRWEEIFKTELGLESEHVEWIMGDTCKKLVYMDTGLVRVPQDKLNEFSKYCGLKWEIKKVGLDHLLDSINKAVEQFQ